ncbi:MAG: phosphoribosylanthranilate isomerase [Desulfobacteraceae bacterium]|nr:phosphoribosylanthranilate isomerase [Desulfobacteraceae bacterium]
MIIQIYEIRTVEAARKIAALDIDHAGLWAASHPGDSALSFEQARAVLDQFPDRMRSVVLTLSRDMEEITALIQQVRPHILHLGSLPRYFSPDMTRHLKNEHPSIDLMRSIAVGDDADIALARSYDGIADYLLLDTYDKKTDSFGATGKIHDWNISKKIVESVRIPVILAGGLGPDNVMDAIRKVGPAGVDSKSGTDIPGTHDKDMELLGRFVRNAGMADEPELNNY